MVVIFIVHHFPLQVFGHLMGNRSRRAKWTHEFNTKVNLCKVHRQYFGMTKSFATAHEVAAEAWKTPPSVIRWLKMHLRMARCIYDQSRIWKFPHSCVHLCSTSGQCDASIRKAINPFFFLLHTLRVFTLILWFFSYFPSNINMDSTRKIYICTNSKREKIFAACSFYSPSCSIWSSSDRWI